MVTRTLKPKPFASAAEISECGHYRYELTRRWDLSTTGVTFVMLNPSTADGMADDPTIRRCVGFASDWGFGGVRVLNLFAYRATLPIDLQWVDDPQGPENYRYLAAAMGTRPDMSKPTVIAAWGASFPKASAAHVASSARWMREAGAHVLGLTKDGHPRHPLYMPAAAVPILWSSL
jgi:hypothetical protein